MKICLIVPCFNESMRLDTKRFHELLKHDPELRLVFVNDGSTDSTSAMLHSIASGLPRVKIMDLPENVGKANAIRLGMLCEIQDKEIDDLDWIGFTDSDSQINLMDLIAFLETANDLDSNISCLFAVRRNQESRLRAFIGSCIAKFLRAGATTLDAMPSDSQCGLKVFRTKLITSDMLSEPFKTRWFFDIEFYLRIALIKSFSLSIFELPSFGAPIGSKVRSDGILKIAREIVVMRRFIHRAENNYFSR